jgi:hypothetical protein
MAVPGLDPKDQEKINAALGRIKNRLLVFSGKGGVGKGWSTSISTARTWPGCSGSVMRRWKRRRARS